LPMGAPWEHSGREAALPEVRKNRKKSLDDANDDRRLVADYIRAMGAGRNSVDDDSWGVPTVDPFSRKRVFEVFRVVNLETFAHRTLRLRSKGILHH